MKLAEYHGKTHATCIVEGENLIPYMALGLAEEAGEVLEIIESLKYFQDIHKAFEDIAMECGDVMWYTSECAHAWGIDLTECQVSELPLKAVAPTEWAFLLTIQALKISGLTKKLIRDNNKVIDEERQQKVANCLGNIVHILEEILKFGPHDLEWVMKNNLEKLSRRKSERKIQGDGSRR